MFFYICPLIAGGPWASLNPGQQVLFMALFRTGWFVESLWSQTLVIHMIRTPKLPFLQSRPSGLLALLTVLGISVGTVIPYTWLGDKLNMAKLPLAYFPWLIGMILAYMILATIMKKVFVWKYGELL